MLHLAIRTGSVQAVKLLFIKEYDEVGKLLGNSKPDDLFGVINNSAMKLLSS